MDPGIFGERLGAGKARKVYLQWSMALLLKASLRLSKMTYLVCSTRCTGAPVVWMTCVTPCHFRALKNNGCPFLATDVSVALKQLHADKMDADGCLCSSALCKEPVSLVTHLTALINAIFSTGYVLLHMRKNTVVPIIKHAHLDPTVLDNYRAITL